MKCPRCKGTGKVPEPSDIGTRIIMLRETAGLSRKQVEDGAGIPHSEYWRIENGKVVDPSLKTVVALAKFFKVTTDALLGVG
jgi:transcriptional regulator with XRE-family HTH domain